MSNSARNPTGSNTNTNTANADHGTLATATHQALHAAERARTLRSSTYLVVAIVMSLFLAACSNLTKLLPENRSEPKSERAEEIAEKGGELRAKNRVRGLCANQFYPIDASIEREFRVSNAPSEKPDTYVLQQSLDGEQSFVEKRRFSSGTEVLNHWKCTPEGLRNVEYTNQITTNNAVFNMETLDSSGITLPSGEWTVGQKWTARYTVDAKMDAGQMANKFRGSVTIDNEVVALGQKVSVPAGEFADAVQVDSVMEINLGIKGRGFPAMKMKSSMWFVPEVGMVKQESTTPYGKGTVEYLGTKEE